MDTTLFFLLVVLSIAVLILLVIVTITLVGVIKLVKTIQRVATIAEDGSKTVADIVHEVKEKIINPMTMSAIFAQILRATSGGRKRRK